MKKSNTVIGVLSLLVLSFSAHAQTELVVDGDFESGTQIGAIGSAWSLTSRGANTPDQVGTCPNVPRTWNSATMNSTGCSAVGNPISGTLAAYNMLDGGGAAPTRMSMNQPVTLPMGLTQADLSLIYSVEYGGPDARSLIISVYDQGNTIQLATLATINFASVGTQIWPGGGQALVSDALAALQPFAGQTVLLDFEVLIPNAWTGPAGLAIDDVSLVVAGGPAAPIPTLSEFGLILLGLLMAYQGLRAVGRRQGTTA